MNCNFGFVIWAKRIPKTKKSVTLAKGNCNTFTLWRLNYLNGVYTDTSVIAKDAVRSLAFYNDKDINFFNATIECCRQLIWPFFD